MRNVAGLSTTDAQKSSDMFMKCRYMDELTGGKGIVFATGTPVSNSMTELYTCLLYTSTQRPRYRQENETPALKKKNVSNGIDNKLKYRKLIIITKEGSEKE